VAERLREERRKSIFKEADDKTIDQASVTIKGGNELGKGADETEVC